MERVSRTSILFARPTKDTRQATGETNRSRPIPDQTLGSPALQHCGNPTILNPASAVEGRSLPTETALSNANWKITGRGYESIRPNIDEDPSSWGMPPASRKGDFPSYFNGSLFIVRSFFCASFVCCEL
jgi:hypothetical protein